mmetsp:Transcript_58346/g.156133  ORF Transcript_58346/g.156133 Transcript_58346/m.156133 type:complete len:410 (-) Transcript_58346:166-1395(-)
MAAKVSPGEAGSVTLLKEEGSMMAYCGAVTTITLFTGPAPVEAVRERLAAVVAANPWLAGRLEQGKGEKRMRLTFDPAGPLRDGLFTVASPGQYKVQGVPYAAIQKVLKGSPLEVKGGVKAVNKDAVQMKVAVIPDGDQWALTLSISHTIADGYTYYQVYNMLSASAEVKSLSPVRKESFSTDLPGAVGKAESKLYLTMSFMFNCASSMLFGRAVKPRCRFVDPAKVEAAKAAAKEDGDSAFVSTNDVLTAAWARLTRAQLLEMSINLRNRLPGIGDADAGNYEFVVFYQEEDCLRPGQIRKSLSAPGRYVRCGRDPPRPLRSGLGLVRARYALITNWATFARDLELPGCKQRLHLPFFDLGEAPCEMAFIFRATREEMGVLMLSRKLQEEDLAGSVFGATVDPVIFPD